MGFLLLGMKLTSSPITMPEKSSRKNLDEFQRLTVDNPSQQARITEMRAVLEQRLALLAGGDRASP